MKEVLMDMGTKPPPYDPWSTEYPNLVSGCCHRSNKPRDHLQPIASPEAGGAADQATNCRAGVSSQVAGRALTDCCDISCTVTATGPRQRNQNLDQIGRPIARTMQQARGLRFRADGYKRSPLRLQRLQRGILDQLSTPMPQLQSENHEANGRHRCM